MSSPIEKGSVVFFSLSIAPKHDTTTIAELLHGKVDDDCNSVRVINSRSILQPGQIVNLGRDVKIFELQDHNLNIRNNK